MAEALADNFIRFSGIPYWGEGSRGRNNPLVRYSIDSPGNLRQGANNNDRDISNCPWCAGKLPTSIGGTIDDIAAHMRQFGIYGYESVQQSIYLLSAPHTLD